MDRLLLLTVSNASVRIAKPRADDRRFGFLIRSASDGKYPEIGFKLTNVVIAGRLGVPTGLHRPRRLAAADRPGGGFGRSRVGPEASHGTHVEANGHRRTEDRFARVRRLLLQRLFQTVFQ